MKKISYSQNFEDIYIWRTYEILAKILPIESPDLNPTIIDIGAWEPIADSVSASFISLGWTAVLVEPQVWYFDLLSKYYESHKNITLLNYAVSDYVGEIVLFVPSQTTGWGSTKKYHALLMNESLSEFLVKVTTLDWLHEIVSRNYFVLKIDAEGSEDEIIRGWQNLIVMPTCICMEGNSEIANSQLITKGYKKYFFDGVNSYYIKEVYYSLLGDFNPLNLLEDGNFILGGNSWLTIQ